MKRLLLASMIVICAFGLGCGGAMDETTESTSPEPASQAAADAQTEARHDELYVCGCGPECTCNAASTAPGTCACGTELEWAHVVKVEDPEALLCSCSEGCTCAVDAADETKCSCGNDLRRVSLEGTGLYYCRCGGTCTCNFVSADPGTCHCGMELVKTG